jgi:adenylate cyclase class 2
MGRALEKNWLYDYPDRKLARADKLLRLREDSRVYITFKGPRQKSEYKEREEIEFDFPDAETARSLCENIGFYKWLYYEKMRETWRLGNCEVVIDELPDLGTFAEIEGPAKMDIEAAVKKLKLPRAYISTTYVEMLQERAAETGGNAREFKFDPHHEFVLAGDDKE